MRQNLIRSVALYVQPPDEEMKQNDSDDFQIKNNYKKHMHKKT